MNFSSTYFVIYSRSGNGHLAEATPVVVVVVATVTVTISAMIEVLDFKSGGSEVDFRL